MFLRLAPLAGVAAFTGEAEQLRSALGHAAVDCGVARAAQGQRPSADLVRRAHGGVEGVVSDPDKPKNKRLRDYIASKIAPDTNASPYASTVPRRDGVGYDTCVGRLRDAGFGDIEHIALDDWATRDDLGAGEVVSVQDAGQNRDTGQPIGVATNPSTKPAPIAAPPDIDEDTANPCDLNPGGTHSDPAAAHEHGVFDVFDDGYPIASPRGTADTFLPWGATWLAGTNWAGFGYSKILAKHGWTPDDAAQTRAVLAEPQHSYVRQGNGRDRYLGLAKLISRSGPSRRPVDRSSVSAPSLSSRTTLALSRVRAMARPTFNRQARIRPASGPRSAPGRGTACDR